LERPEGSVAGRVDFDSGRRSGRAIHEQFKHHLDHYAGGAATGSEQCAGKRASSDFGSYANLYPGSDFGSSPVGRLDFSVDTGGQARSGNRSGRWRHARETGSGNHACRWRYSGHRNHRCES
jgi:hypothetical protein